jgi:DNA-binding beta-propeller fold protein YncE
VLRKIAFAALLLAALGCAEEFHGRPPLEDGLHYPIATAVDEANGLLYVVNSNFDLAYQEASLVAFDLADHKLTGPTATFGSFPGTLLVVDSTTAKGKLGFLAVRGDNSLTWFRLEGTGSQTAFVCNDDEDQANNCGGDFVVTEGLLLEEEVEENVDVGSDPFGLAFLPGDGERPDRLVVAAMRGGQFSLMELDKTGFPTLVDQVILASGLHSVTADPATGILYATTKTYPLLYRYRVEETAQGPRLDKLSSVGLPAPYSTSQFGRGIALSSDGRRVLVTYRTPAALLALDNEDHYPEGEQAVIGTVPLGSRPGNLQVLPSGPGGGDVAYVPCYGDDTLWAVDVETLLPLAIIPVGAGPYDVTAGYSDGLKRAYVTNFLDHTVSVVDIDPTSPYYHTQIAEIH